MNNATLNIHVQIFVLISGIYQGREFLGHMEALCFTSRGTAKLFPSVVHHITTPSTRYNDFTFSVSSLTILVIYLFILAILVDVKWYVIVI